MASLRDEVTGKLKACRPQMESFLARLVQIKSENPPGNHYTDCRDLICDEITRAGLDPIVRELEAPSSQERTYAVQTFVGNAKPVVYFHGHYDVVPVFTAQQFTPEIKNGKMFGRGTADMKAGLALMLYAAKVASECTPSLKGRIGLTFVPDEETGGARGSQLLRDHGILVADAIAMFTPEPTSGRIFNASRGAISMKITTHGKAAHVGEHYRGVSAFDEMHAIVNRLIELRSEIAKRETDFPISPAAARQSILLIGGTVQGGTNFNCVPEQCSFTVDRRFNPEESLEAEEQALLDAIHSAAKNSPSIEIFQRAPGSASSSDSKPARALAKNAAITLGEQPAFEMGPGLFETRFYSQLGIPAYAFGPGLLSVAHGPNEYVDLNLVERYAAIYALTAIDLLTKAQ
ncbi:MAG TPA: ArgE/DapE family deacylase [Candidatus Sulfotelmatobacter sp.]|nr:ArgE/DapE family deacylase [Candidatus Sulfotelmatobacter sp.]